MKSLFSLIFILYFGVLSAQDYGPSPNPTSNTGRNQKPSFAERLYYGGNVQLQFGTYTVVGISPLIGYKITEQLSVGVTPSYTYFRDNFYRIGYSVYGGSVFSRYFVIEDLFLHAEYERLYYPVIAGTGNTSKFYADRALVGGGYVMRFSDNAGFFLMGMYDLLWKQQSSFYLSPFVFRGGFVIGI